MIRVVFMGTPDFAVPTLQAFIADPAIDVIAAYSQPPRKSGRGMKLTKNPVHQLAEANNIPVFTPTTLKETQIHDADIAVVAAYGLLLPKRILEGYEKGCINIHPSDLPKYRGAAPIQRTIMAGETKTDCCIMQMDEGLDTGDVLLRESFDIPNNMTAGELHDEMSNLGAKMTLEVIKNYEKLAPIKQSGEASYASKISKSEALIDFNDSAKNIYNKVRGLNPYPKAYMKNLKILECEYRIENISSPPGTIINDKLEITCKDGIITPIKVQPAGKSAMNIEDYLRGNNDKI